MGSNYKKSQKHSNRVAGIILVSLFLSTMIGALFEKESIGIVLACIPLILFGVLLIFVEIRSYGYGIAAALFVGEFLMGLADKKDRYYFIGCFIFVLIFLSILCYKNIKKQNNKQ